MARRPRHVLPGVALHVVQRGNNRQACFLSDSDRLLYLLHLRELAARHGCALHAYCLMPNHVHLLMTPFTEEALSTLMRELGQRYVQYVNRAYGRSGTLWEGRFRSCIAESSRYVLACYRYIELNPVRACLVSAPNHYRWSSYRANAESAEDPLLAAHPEYLALGADDALRRRAYQELFRDALEPKLVERIREATNRGYPLASEGFAAGIARARGWKLGPGQPGRPATRRREADNLPSEMRP